MAAVATPASFDRAVAVLPAAAAEGRSVRIAGGGTKARWGAPPRDRGQVLLSTARLAGEIEHRPADGLVTVSAGTVLDRLQAALRPAGQRLALDPPRGDTATVGGIFATDDSGPLRHRYGTPRDLIVAMTVGLADGTLLRTGAPVLRSGAGYDLPRLFCGSFGTLGIILSLTVRTTPLPEAQLTVLGQAGRPRQLAAALAGLAAAPLDLQALDVAWRRGRGGILAQLAGGQVRRRADRAVAALRAVGLERVEVVPDDGPLWERQRAGQRSADRALLRIAAAPSDLATLLELADRWEATVTGRGAPTVLYLELAPEAVAELRAQLPPGRRADLLDWPRGSGTVTERPPAWSALDPATLALTRAIKASFDPAATCNPGLFVGGI